MKLRDDALGWYDLTGVSVRNSSEEFSRIITADLERRRAIARAGNIKIAP